VARNSQFKIIVVLLACIALMVLRLHLSKPPEDTRGAAIEMARLFLTRAEFSITDEKPEDHITAQRNQCEVIIKPLAPEGWNESQMRIMSRGRRLLYVTGGRVYEEHQPVWRTWSAMQVQRFLTRIGIDVPKAIVFGVSPSLKCGDIELDWKGLTDSSPA